MAPDRAEAIRNGIHYLFDKERNGGDNIEQQRVLQNAPDQPRVLQNVQGQQYGFQNVQDQPRVLQNAPEQKRNNIARTVPHRYTQNWRSYGGAVAHMLRFFFKLPNATIDEMSAPTLAAWMACYRSVAKLTDKEKQVAEDYFAGAWDDKKESVQTVAKQNGISETEAWEVVHKLTREVAIERGLADR